MSKRTREVWHCDVCGWEWLPDTDKIPERCPNRTCRKRNWNNPNKEFADTRKLIESLKRLPIKGGFNEDAPHAPTCRCVMCRLPKPINGDCSIAMTVGEVEAIRRGEPHLKTCKCLMCKPPKSTPSSS